MAERTQPDWLARHYPTCAACGRLIHAEEEAHTIRVFHEEQPLLYHAACWLRVREAQLQQETRRREGEP